MPLRLIYLLYYLYKTLLLIIGYAKKTAGLKRFKTINTIKYRLTKELVAVKTIIKTFKTMKNITKKKFILKYLLNHPQLLIKRDIYYKRNNT